MWACVLRSVRGFLLSLLQEACFSFSVCFFFLFAGAVLASHLLPPLLSKKVIDEGLSEGFASLAELLRRIGKEFGRSASSRRFKKAGMKAKSQLHNEQSIPKKIQSKPHLLSTFLSVAAGCVL